MNNAQSKVFPQELLDEWRETKELAQELEELMATAGWKRFHELLQKQVLARQGGMWTPTKGFDGAFEKEFARGEIAGLLVAMELPAQTLQAAKELLKEYQQDARNGQEVDDGNGGE